MIADPFVAGGVQETFARAFPAVAVTPVGAPGTVDGITFVVAAEKGPMPTLLVARTRKV